MKKTNAKAGYADCFLIPIPRKNIEKYRRMARAAGKVWKEYGAIDYKECAGDDLRIKGVVTFIKQTRLKNNETAIFSWITYKSRKHRDAVNKKVMADPRIAAMMSKKDEPPFDFRKMVYGGFKIIVSE